MKQILFLATILALVACVNEPQTKKSSVVTKEPIKQEIVLKNKHLAIAIVTEEAIEQAIAKTKEK